MVATSEEFLNNFEEVNYSYCSDDDSIKYNPFNKQHSKKKRKSYKQIRPKVSIDWTHGNIVKLINAVEKRPTLWDTSCPQYKLPKTPSWQEIGDHIGQTADECKAKWSNLRVTFKTNLSKCQKQKSGSSAGANVVWKYFNAMSFLGVNETPQTTESISSMTIHSEESSDPPIQQKRDRKMPSVSQLPSVKQLPSIPQLPSVPQLSSSHSDVYTEMLAKTNCTIAENPKERSQFDVFGAHVAAELHSLPLQKAIIAKRKLARALVDVMDEVQSGILS